MKIAIIGYGKMGKEIEKVAKERSHEISLIINIDNLSDLNIPNLKKVDVAIDFTTPSTVIEHILTCFDADIPIVTGTTGWNSDHKNIIDICIERKQSLFISSNFSIGVNIFFAVNEFLAKLMNQFPQYDVSIKETHHTQKLDAPSGTAISLADHIINNLDRKSSWELNSQSTQEAIEIDAIREGEIKGIHDVIYDSEIDYLTIKHYTKSRKGLAFGAVLAAEFILNKKGVFTMKDLTGL